MISIFALRDPKALKDHTRKLNQSKYSTSSEHINSEESNFTSTLMQTSQKFDDFQIQINEIKQENQDQHDNSSLALIQKTIMLRMQWP